MTSNSDIPVPATNPLPSNNKGTPIETSLLVTSAAVLSAPGSAPKTCYKQLDYDETTSFQLIPKHEQTWSDVKVGDHIRFTDITSTGIMSFDQTAWFEFQSKGTSKIHRSLDSLSYANNSSFPITEGMKVEVIARQENHINSIHCTPHLEFLLRHIRPPTDNPTTTVITPVPSTTVTPVSK